MFMRFGISLLIQACDYEFRLFEMDFVCTEEGFRSRTGLRIVVYEWGKSGRKGRRTAQVRRHRKYYRLRLGRRR